MAAVITKQQMYRYVRDTIDTFAKAEYGTKLFDCVQGPFEDWTVGYYEIYRATDTEIRRILAERKKAKRGT